MCESNPKKKRENYNSEGVWLYRPNAMILGAETKCEIKIEGARKPEREIKGKIEQKRDGYKQMESMSEHKNARQTFGLRWK